MLPIRNGKPKQNNRKLASFREKNKELASALDFSRKEVTDLREDILKLKQERQVIMERNSFLESKLNTIDILYSNSAKPLIVKTMAEVEEHIKDARSVSKTFHHNHTRIISSPTCTIPLDISKRSAFGQGIQESSTPVIDKSHCFIPSPIAATPPSYHTPLDISDPGTMTTIKCFRPKRSCTSLVTSYQEPSRTKKLRRDDPFTESFSFFSKCTNTKQTKVKQLKVNKQLKERKSLKDITNSARLSN